MNTYATFFSCTPRERGGVGGGGLISTFLALGWYCAQRLRCCAYSDYLCDRSVPNVNERRCTAVTTPPEGGCGTIHIGAVPDHHNNVVCITVAEPERADLPDLYMDIRAEQQDITAPPETCAARPADDAPGAAEAALSGLTLLELAERAGLDAELLDGMLEAMDGDELAVETMLREQIVANPELQPAPALSKPELSEDELAERYLMGGAGSVHRRRRDDGEVEADAGELIEEAEAPRAAQAPQLRAEEQKKQLLAEAALAQAAREAARAEFEQEMIGATNTVKKRQQDEAAALSAAAQVKEAQEVLRDNAQKLGEMSVCASRWQFLSLSPASVDRLYAAAFCHA